MMRKEIALSFGGCGWASAWSFGVAKGIAKQHEKIQISKTAGASGEAWWQLAWRLNWMEMI